MRVYIRPGTGHLYLPTWRYFAPHHYKQRGKRTYRTTPSRCKSCPYKDKCGADAQGKKALTTHIWLSFLDLTEVVRKTELGKRLYAQRKETIERVFADAKEKHAMGYTHHRVLAAVTRWVRLMYAAMNLKKLALRS